MGAYSLRKDDRIRLTLTGPDGTSTVDHEDIQERSQARTMRFAGKKRPPNGWQAGEWTASVDVIRDGKTYTRSRSFQVVDAPKPQ